MRPFILALLVAAGCQTYAQHRAALVPHQSPLPIDGQPLQSAGALALGASNLGNVTAPNAGDPGAGDIVPSDQLRGSLDLRASRNVSLGVAYEHGLAAGATRVKDSEPPITDEDVTGYGAHIAVSIPTSNPAWRIGVATELMMWTIPWVQYSTCVDNCGTSTGTTVMSTGRDQVPTIALAIVPSYRAGRLTVFGGFTARNHPTIIEKIDTVLPNEPADVQSGPFNITAQAGAEIEISSGVTASVLVHQTLTRDPVIYGPSLAAMLTIPLGRDEPPPAAPLGALPPPPVYNP